MQYNTNQSNFNPMSRNMNQNTAHKFNQYQTKDIGCETDHAANEFNYYNNHYDYERHQIPQNNREYPCYRENYEKQENPNCNYADYYSPYSNNCVQDSYSSNRYRQPEQVSNNYAVNHGQRPMNPNQFATQNFHLMCDKREPQQYSIYQCPPMQDPRNNGNNYSIYRDQFSNCQSQLPDHEKPMRYPGHMNRYST